MVLSLDDVKEIKKRDKGKLLRQFLQIPEAFSAAVKQSAELTLPLRYFKKYSHIVVAGMGGSALAGELLKDIFPNLPIEICRDYHLPSYVTNESSLVFIISYSGNTEETLSCLLDAQARGCNTLAMSAGGKLREYCAKLGMPHIDVPSELETRAALPYLVMIPAIILRKLSIARLNSEEIAETKTLLDEVREACRPETKQRKNPAKQVAKKLYNSRPSVYAPPTLGSIARRIKSYLNENTKIPARWDVWPELNHLEAVGWAADKKLLSKESILILRDTKEPEEISARIELTKKHVFEGKTKKIVELRTRGSSPLARVFYLSYMADFLTFYLALLYGVDPRLIGFINKIKAKLASTINTVGKLDGRVETIYRLKSKEKEERRNDSG